MLIRFVLFFSPTARHLLNCIENADICIDCDFTGTYSSLSCFGSAGKQKSSTFRSICNLKTVGYEKIVFFFVVRRAFSLTSLSRLNWKSNDEYSLFTTMTNNVCCLFRKTIQSKVFPLLIHPSHKR